MFLYFKIEGGIHSVLQSSEYRIEARELRSRYDLQEILELKQKVLVQEEFINYAIEIYLKEIG